MTVVAGPGSPPTSANVARALVDLSSAHPERPALLRADGSVGWTFADLAGQTARIASGLELRGLRPGSRVVLLTRDPEAALMVAVATLWAGGTVVTPPVSGGWRPALRATARLRPDAVVADPVVWLALAAVPGLAGGRIRIVTGHRRWPGLVTLGELAGGHDRLSSEPTPRPVDAPALITWTTGTTGHPRPVVRTHGILTAQHLAIRALRAPRAGDVDLVGLPAMALHDLACGTSLVMPSRADADPDGRRLRDLVSNASVTTAVGFPVLFERLVDGAGPSSLPGLHSIHVGGAPVRAGLLDRLASVAPNATVVVVYGATEAEPIAAVDAREVRSSAGDGTRSRGMLVGKPCPGIDLRLVPLEGCGAAAGSGAAFGRVLVRGDRVARDPVHSGSDGWLDTGDVGALDDDGRLWLLGRTSNLVRGGVAPATVEDAVGALEDVAASVLVPIPGPHGSRLVLAVQPVSPTSARAVQARVTTMASDRGWALDRVATVHRLPRDERTGKIDYRRLRSLVG